MKRIIIIWIGIIACFVSGMAQTPPLGINYQAVARDVNGAVWSNKVLSIRFSILQGSINGNPVWVEEHSSVSTNAYGVFNVVVGQGSKKGGSCNYFSDIEWGTSSYYLKTEVNFTGTNYSDLGQPSPINWVPYALYALKAGNSSSADSDSTNELQTLQLNGSTLSIMHNGKVDGSVNLTSNDADSDPTNEIQELTYDAVNEHLILSKTNNIIDLLHLKDDADADPKNEIQDLYELNDTIFITNKELPRKIDLKQNLTLTGNKLSIKRGNTIIIDGDTTNEIQDLILSGDLLKISKNSAATTIDLSSYKDNTDKQTLSINKADTTLSISNGNTLKINDLVNVPWVGFSTKSLSNQILSTSNAETIISWGEEFDNGNCFDVQKFITPAKGIYNFSLTVSFTTLNITLRIYKNNAILREFTSIQSIFSHNMLLPLITGDEIKIIAVYSGTLPSYIDYGYFSGFRVN